VCNQGNFGPLLHAIQERLQGCLPPFGKSNHAAIFLLPEYKQRIVHEVVVTREVMRWSNQINDDIRDAMNAADWDMFRSSYSEFTDVVMSFIAKLEDTVLHPWLRWDPFLIKNCGSMDPSAPP